MDDPYKALGVEKSATTSEIKRAYKKLVRELHPDLNPDDKAAEDRFKEVAQAYELLGDQEKRRRFDAGEIDATGAERQSHRFYRDFADDPDYGGHAAEDGFANADELEEFLRQAFGGRGAYRRAHTEFKSRGPDFSYTMRIEFLDAANGATRSIMLPDGKQLKVTIPQGARDRQTIRLKGQGGSGFGGGPPGDAYVELHVEPHAFFERRDNNIHLDVPVTLREAVLGGQIEVPTIKGPVTLTVPAGSNTGQVLRLRNRGVLDQATQARGHQMVKLSVVLPKDEEPELRAFLERWQPEHAQNPREEFLR
jgi:DnaJ-class molecular chaperone